MLGGWGGNIYVYICFDDSQKIVCEPMVQTESFRRIAKMNTLLESINVGQAHPPITLR